MDQPQLSLAGLTALMSAVGKRRPDLVQDRNVRLFIQLCIEEAKAVRVERAIRGRAARSDAAWGPHES